MTLIEQFDKLKPHITTKEGKDLAKEFRKYLKKHEDYDRRMDQYLSDTLDGMKPEKAAHENRLL